METSVKEWIINALPPAVYYMLRGIVQKIELIISHMRDLRRYLRWSPLGGKPKTAAQLAATITMDYHRIEKGLSLPQPRPGFGTDVIKRLAFNIPHYAALPDINSLPLEASYGVLRQWLELSNGTAGSVEQEARSTLRFLQEKYGKFKEIGGVVTLRKDDIQKFRCSAFKDFFASRYTIREFTDEKVSVNEIKNAIAITRKTPSVCNRQSWRVRAFLEPETCQKVLSVQNGNRGFGDKVKAVLIITTDLQTFLSSGERYQGWIDGGMFSMALALALHAQGLGTCCLNWSVSSKTDSKLRKIANIPDNELIIMMMAVGHLKEEFKVATSPRIEVDDILISVS